MGATKTPVRDFTIWFSTGGGFEPVMLGVRTVILAQLLHVASRSHFDYLAREVEDNPRKQVHMSTNPVTSDWSLWPEEHHTLEIMSSR